jgi:hypothetical protein
MAANNKQACVLWEKTLYVKNYKCGNQRHHHNDDDDDDYNNDDDDNNNKQQSMQMKTTTYESCFETCVVRISVM